MEILHHFSKWDCQMILSLSVKMKVFLKDGTDLHIAVTFIKFLCNTCQLSSGLRRKKHLSTFSNVRLPTFLNLTDKCSAVVLHLMLRRHLYVEESQLWFLSGEETVKLYYFYIIKLDGKSDFLPDNVKHWNCSKQYYLNTILGLQLLHAAFLEVQII